MTSTSPSPADRTPAGWTAAEIYRQLDEFVVGQKRLKRLLASRLALHLERAKRLDKGVGRDEPNECILILGPSGAGKTWSVESAARLVNVPFVVTNGAQLVEEGYSGTSFSETLRSLVANADDDAKVARKGIVFLDEWDKRVQLRHEKRGFSEGVQGEVLRAMEGAIVDCTRSQQRMIRPTGPQSVDTRGMMFVFAGAFQALDEVAKSIRKRQTVGFQPRSIDPVAGDADLYDALCEYGMLPEFLNRLTAIVTVEQPSSADLQEMLARRKGPLNVCNRKLATFGAKLELSPGARESLAAHVLHRGTLCRGMQTVLRTAVDQIVFDGLEGTYELDRSDIEHLCQGGAFEVEPAEAASDDIELESKE